MLTPFRANSLQLTLNNSVTRLSYRDARLDCVKQNDEKRQQEQRLVSDLWAWLTLLAVVGAYLLTWLFLLILKALQISGYS